MRYIYIIATLLFSTLAFGQEIQLIDGDTKQPIKDAYVFSKDGLKAYNTDSKGKVRLDAFSNTDSIFVRQVGYKLMVFTKDKLDIGTSIISMYSSGLMFEDVVVSASKWEQNRRDLSSHAVTISKRQIELSNPQTAADLLATSGAVFVQKSQAGGGSPMMRGFSTNRVLLVIDGVRMNTSIFRAGNVQNALRIDANNVSMAEAVFGPGSLIYGSDAIGGVMDFKTLNPTLSNTGKAQFSGNAMGRFSSANIEKVGHLDLNLGFNKVAILASGTFSDYGDTRMGSMGGFESYRRNIYQSTLVSYDSLGRKRVLDTFYRNSNPLVQKGSGFNQWNVMSKIRIQPNQFHRLTIAFHMSRSSNVPRYDRLTAIGSNGVPTFSEWYYGPEQWLMTNVEYLNTKSSAIHSEMKINIAYQQNKESRHDRRFGNRWLRRQNETVHSISTNIDFNKKINKTFDVFYGVEALVNINKSVADRLDVRIDTTQRFTSRYPNATWQSYAAYISARAKIGEKWTINAGLRYNHFLINGSFDTSLFKLPYNKTDNSFGAVTGSAGIVFLPSTSWKVYTNFASGFRAPNVDDIGKVFETVPGLLVVPNGNLKPEYSLNVELGIEKRFGNVAQIMVVGYYNHLLNALSLAPFQLEGKDSLFFDGRNNGLRAIQNSSYAYVCGVQAMARFYFGNGFGAWASYNYQYGREKLLTDQGSELYPMRHVSPMFGSVHITYQRKKFSADIYTDFSGRIKNTNLATKTLENLVIFPNDENGNPFSPGWYTINFKASYDITKYLTLNGGIENITDQQFRTYSSGINAPGINFIIGLRAKF